MTSKDWLTEATKKLEQAEIGTARLDALVLLEDVVGKDRTHLLAHPDQQLSSAQLTKLTKLLIRREQHEPLAYVRGKTEFYGREFIISPAVLEPRPESETMIELLKNLEKAGKLPTQPKIADVGAGCGALGIIAALELPNCRVELLEIDKNALKIAKINVDKHTTDISAIRSNLLGGSGSEYDVLLCNLPYVPDNHIINRAAMKEPRLAIFGGPDGLNLYRKLFYQARKAQKQPLFILTESLPPQHPVMADIAASHNYRLQQTNDFIQLFELAEA